VRGSAAVQQNFQRAKPDKISQFERHILLEAPKNARKAASSEITTLFGAWLTP
jgi:hypothetical protein